MCAGHGARVGASHLSMRSVSSLGVSGKPGSALPQGLQSWRPLLDTLAARDVPGPTCCTSRGISYVLVLFLLFLGHLYVDCLKVMSFHK